MQVMEQRMDEFIRVSKFAVWSSVFVLVVLTGLLMFVMFNIDLDELFGAERFAMKVGGTAITWSDFAALKQVATPKSGEISDAAFADELLETLFLAEAGRRMRLDRHLDFVSRVQAFDRAIAAASAPPDLSRSLFLLEELARKTRKSVIEDADAAGTPVTDDPGQDATGNVAPARPTRLHLRTILADDETAAKSLLEAAADGVSFDQLNASWSRSPYAAIGGDLGWVTPENLPPGIFELVEGVPVGKITRAFSDGNGVHLFMVEARPVEAPGLKDRHRLGRQRIERRQRALDRFMQDVKRTIPWFLHPSLLRQ